MCELNIDHKVGTINGEVALDCLSHFVLDGKVFVNEACYADLDFERHTEIRIIFIRKSAYHSRFIDWVINKSEFKDFYITKDVEEGFKNGFEVVTVFDYNEMLDALRVIRMTYEFKSGFYYYLRNRRSVLAHIEAVLNVMYDHGLDHGHTMSDDLNNSFSQAVDAGLDFSKCEEYIKCAV